MQARRTSSSSSVLLALCATFVAALASPALASSRKAEAEAETKKLEAHRRVVEERVRGQGFTVVVEPPFVVIGDESPGRVRGRASGFLRWAVTLLEKDWFDKRPDEVIEVWLFRNEASYRKGAKKFFDDEPETPFGYYSPEDNALIMNIGPGAGTLSHELVHPYMAANFPDVPAWFNEGVASLYEQPRERDGKLVGTTNWRLPGLVRLLRAKGSPTLATMISTTTNEFYGADYDSYAMARFLCQYLQDHGLLAEFYKTFRDDEEDRTGKRALEAVLGQDLASFEPVWRAWVAKLRR